MICLYFVNLFVFVSVHHVGCVCEDCKGFVM